MGVRDIASELKQTEKGRLVYGRPKVLHSKNFELTRTPQPVFSLDCTNVILENCEEASFARLKILNEEEQGGLFRQSIDEPTKDIRPDGCEVIAVGKGVDVLLESVAASIHKDTEEKIQEKTQFYQNATNHVAEEAMRHYNLKQQSLNRKLLFKQEQIMKYIRESEEDANRIKSQNVEQRKSRDHMIRTKIEEAERRRQLKLEQGRERLKTAEPIVIKCTELHNSLVQQMQDINNKEFLNNNELTSIFKNVQDVQLSILNIMEECRSNSVMEPSHLADLSNAYNTLLELSKKLVSSLETLKLEERKRKQEEKERLELNKAKEEEKERILRAQREKEMSQKNPEFACPSLPKELAFSVSRSAHHRYKQLRNLLTEYEEKSKQFTSNKANMKLIMGINNGISVPVSSISSRSGSDIKNNLSDLKEILKGRNIKVANQLTNISNNEHALSYAKLSMAKKFVKQAEGQVAFNHAAAFSFALTLLGVWAEDEVLGKLILAQMQSRCPFIVPFYIPQLPDQDEKDYNKSRGYLYDDSDQVEGQDKYLVRMSGLIRSYAAIIQSPLPPGVKSHPHGIAEGWGWLARMLNLDPWPEITATALLVFLEVAGHALMKKYGRQFEKLLYSIAHDYFPKIQKVSTGGGGGPLQRLQMFLKDCIKSRKVPEPEGFLDSNFWNTSHHAGVVGS